MLLARWSSPMVDLHFTSPMVHVEILGVENNTSRHLVVGNSNSRQLEIPDNRESSLLTFGSENASQVRVRNRHKLCQKTLERLTRGIALLRASSQ